MTEATSDGLEQLIIRSQGCLLLSAKDLKEEVEYVESLIAEEKVKLTEGPARSGKNYLLSHADEEMQEYFEEVRLGKIRMDSAETKKTNKPGTGNSGTGNRKKK